MRLRATTPGCGCGLGWPTARSWPIWPGSTSTSPARGWPDLLRTSVAPRCASGCDDVVSVPGGAHGSSDLGVERGAQLGQVQVAVDPAELLACFDHAGGAPAQRHLPVPPALDVGRA